MQFKTLLENHYLRILKAALGYMGELETAREAAHEAMLRAYLARESYDETRPFYPWMYRIVKHTCIDRKRRLAKKSSYVEGHHESAAASPLHQLEQRECQRRLMLALGCLTEEHREVLNLRHFQDLSYQEIAETLEISQGTVMSRLYRARKSLHNQMKEL